MTQAKDFCKALQKSLTKSQNQTTLL